jgi:hypothetical protein
MGDGFETFGRDKTKRESWPDSIQRRAETVHFGAVSAERGESRERRGMTDSARKKRGKVGDTKIPEPASTPAPEP